jgi:hypothetical protein
MPLAAKPLSVRRAELTDTVALIKDRYDRLPGTADGIATFLAQQDASGQRGSAHNCALGDWLGANLAPGYLLRIDDDMAKVIDATTEGRKGAVMYVFPHLAHITTFIRRFDNGDYPDLDANPSAEPEPAGQAPDDDATPLAA